jgi:ribosomal protein L37AE/L43A
LATSPQRAYKAACPSCGAPVEFRSAASASAVCSFCRSTLVRDGQALRRIGVTSELFDDHSPLQLGAAGRYQGEAFTLVGRLQYGYDGGTWNEWHALFDNGRSGWLSEDNGAYVFSFDAPPDANAPAAEALRAGERVLLAGRAWDIASATRARLIAAEGELPFAPRLQGDFVVADARNERGEVATLDYASPGEVHLSIGQGVPLSDLALSGLRETGEKTLAARSVECPSCGTSLEVKLASTQSIACHQCKAVVDLSADVGADLSHYAQANAGHDGAQPQLPLGATAVLALGKEGPLPWTVVGFVERCDIPDSAEDETTYWREYLVFNQGAGFAFIVDAEDGWSYVRPITGAPQARGSQALWQGVSYQERYSYTAKVTWVQGEFYWRVQRDERARVTDYDAGLRRLSREQTGNEVTWSAGEAIDATVLAKAFGVPIAAASAFSDAAPLSSLSGLRTRGNSMVIWGVVALIVLLVVMDACSDDCDDVRSTFGASSAEYQQCKRSGGSGVRIGGGSYGGWSSGGGHK